MALKIKLLTEDAMIPTRATPDSAGLDLFASEEIQIEPGKIQQIKTGISMAIPEDSYGRIAERSSLALKGLTIIGGVVDRDYRGEIIVILKNCTQKPVMIQKHQKIAQLIITKVYFSKIEIVEELNTTERGEKRFGWSDKITDEVDMEIE